MAVRGGIVSSSSENVAEESTIHEATSSGKISRHRYRSSLISASPAGSISIASPSSSIANAPTPAHSTCSVSLRIGVSG
jgi:hypothetical protein